MTTKQLQSLLTDRGFALHSDPGLISGTDDVGRTVSLFTWGNDVHAEQSLIPRKYLVVCALGGRWRLPTVEWVPFLPVAEQTPRPWKDVLVEFDEVFLPAIREEADMPAGIERYELTHGLGDVIERLDYVQLRYRKGVRTIADRRRHTGPASREPCERRAARAAGTVDVVVAGSTLTLTFEGGRTSKLELGPDTSWASLSMWLNSMLP